MEIGICVVLPENEIEDAMRIAAKYSVDSYKICNTFKSPKKNVILKEACLVAKINFIF